MWPPIFDLIAGLGKQEKLLLFNHDDSWWCVIPLIQGKNCDFNACKWYIWYYMDSLLYVVPLLGLFRVLWFYCPKILRKQGVLQVESEGGGH
jgi:FHS family L-fucose permease-like MFS transporter